MLVLALETSSQAGSVALLECPDHALLPARAEAPGAAREGAAREGEASAEPRPLPDESRLARGGPARDNVLSQRLLALDRRSAQTLMPAMAEVLSGAGRKPAHVGLVAVTIGPGSFTGLRVGVTAAKTFAYATGCQCLGVDTLEVLAEQALALRQVNCEVHAVLDAQRKELFLARFRPAEGGPMRLDDNRIVSIDGWLAALAPGTLVTGGGVERLLDWLPAGVIVAPPHVRQPQAVAVGRLAWRQYLAGRRDDLWKLAPKYLRLSAAEEKVR